MIRADWQLRLYLVNAMPESQDPDTLTNSGSVTPERVARLRAIFEAAVDKPVAERRAHVERACAGDPALLHELNAMLAADGHEERPLSSAPEEGRFPVGTVLAGRYRILGLLGKGGMGEVYKAFDLILNQIVALKFLSPAHLSEAALVRFRNEVRVARQVSHPNVCRVYDVGIVEGLHFLSMEYIDGEDLASLLRRIGRLPQDKAIEFSRKVCAGLSAAHERGVLHRDLKPANIMIDGRGQVRITDFGLAVLEAEIPLSDLRSGTPAYMSPEQKAGKEVTVRSDLYSLGLVLHEMFTGKPRKDSHSTPSELVKDLDPAIERLILRCLEEEPKRRPNSAIHVAMALPGGDPVAAALAAGETPSPEMVAASQEKEGLSPRAAIICLVVVLILAVLAPFLSRLSSLTVKAPLETPPDVLAFQARKMLNDFGYSASPKTSAYGFSIFNLSYLTWLQLHDATHRDALLATHQPPVNGFWYREHNSDLIAREFSYYTPQAQNQVAFDLPANDEPGMIRMILDAKGRLFFLEARPAETKGPGRSVSFDLAQLLVAAGLDASRFQSAEAEFTPPMAFDARISWTGTYSGDRKEELKIDAAAWQGRPVYFKISGDWESTNPARTPVSFPLILTAVLFAGTAVAAWNNLRLGRGDRRGASHAAAYAFVIQVVCWALGADHVAGFWEIGYFIMGFSFAAFAAGLVWLLYVAIEPYVRRNWPDALISLTRVQSGRFRDPLVASHVLVALVAVGAIGAYFLGINAAAIKISPPTPELIHGLNSLPAFFSDWFAEAGFRLVLFSAFILIVVLLRLLIRRVVVADIVAVLLFSIAIGAAPNTPSLGIFSGVSLAIALASFNWMLRRYGLLPMLLIGQLSVFVPVAVPHGWYAGRIVFGFVIPLVIGAWALWVILSSKTAARESS
jgi:serine/threonine-protein kinase